MSGTALRQDALRLIANGKTATELAARAAEMANYDHYRNSDALRAHVGADLAKFIDFSHCGNDFAAEMAGFDARIAAEMAALEAEGYTRDKAAATLNATEGQPSSISGVVTA